MARLTESQAGGANVLACQAQRASVYCLKDPRTMQIRYVGITSESLDRRLTNHCSAAKRNPTRPVCAWINHLAADQMVPLIEALEEVSSGEEAYAREVHWISTLRAEGKPILNCTDGGLGWAGHTHSPEARRKISKANRGKPISAQQRQRQSMAMTGRKLTEDHKAKVSIAAKGRKISDMTCARMSEARTGVPSPKTSGALNGRAILTPEQAELIRSGAWGLTEAMGATGISKTQFYRVKKGEQWRGATHG